MKKLFVLFAGVLFVMSSASAQVEKGKFLLAGTTAFSYTSTVVKYVYDGTEEKDFKMTMVDIEFSPTFGYFVMDNLAIGLDFGYTSSKGKFGDGDWSDPSTTMSAALFGRYYMGSSAFKPFGQLQFGYMGIADSKDDVDKNSGLIYGGTLGADYFLNSSVALELGISYNMGSLKNKADNLEVYKPGVLSFGIGIAVTFGGE